MSDLRKKKEKKRSLRSATNDFSLYWQHLGFHFLTALSIIWSYYFGTFVGIFILHFEWRAAGLASGIYLSIGSILKPLSDEWNFHV
jgi:hypothetical protein